MIEYTTLATTHSADTYLVSVYINGDFVTSSTTCSHVFATAENISAISILPSSNFVGMLDIASVSFAQYDKELGAADTDEYINVRSSVSEN